ncbi:MAG: ABC transporter permease subunit [Candidatus Limiplasma sp.]|nr:ABC transporter permease subunit [Candidatus Limiplasma sp.]
MFTIFKREFLAYFRTPVGYVFLGVFTALSGVIFYLGNLATLSGELLIYLSQLTMLTMLLTPVLTMRLLCEERQRRTDQLLLTSPVSLTRIVLGKYLAAAAVLLMGVALTNVATLLLGLYGTVYPGEWFVGYLGFTLQSLAFLAMDLFVTGFTRNQVSAAIVAFATNFLVWMLDLLADKVSLPAAASALRFLSLYKRYEPFILGQLSFASLLYFVTLIALCLTATVRVMDARRFSQGGAA